MKTLIPRILTVLCAAGLLLPALAQQSPDDNNSAPTPATGDGTVEIQIQTPPPDDGAAPAPADNTTAAPPATVNLSNFKPQLTKLGTNVTPVAGSTRLEFTPPAGATGTNSDQIRLNFRNAPLEMVLSYLSDAAGFIIVLDAPVHGNVSVISSRPVTKDEAVDLLNSVLNKNGLAAIRSERTLTIVDKSSAKTRDIPVKVSNEPNQIPKNDEIVTQIIPIRFVEADQLVKDLASFVSPEATIVANEAGNSIVITDTQANIRHLVEIIRAIDNSAQGETEIRVFHLLHANPTDVASLLGEVFPSNNSSGTGQSQSPIRFGGLGGGGAGGGGGGPGGFFARMMAANTQSSGSDNRMQKQTQVIAVADLRTSSVVVTASKDLMDQIESMMHELDVSSSRDQNVYVFHMNNGDPQQAVQVLQSMFQGSGTTRSGTGSGSSSSQNSALMQRQQNNSSSGSQSVSGSATSSSFGGSGARTGGGGGGGQLF